MVYFRPMSLLKYKKTGAVGNKDSRGKNIAPELSKTDVQLSVDGQVVQTRTVETVREYTSKRIGTMQGLLINASYPKNLKPKDWYEVCVNIKDVKSKEQGMACVSMRNLPWSF